MDPDADNPTLLQVLVLERVDRAKNMARFYVLSIEPTLFEDLALVRGGAASEARGVSGSTCTRPSRSRRSSSRNGSIARGAADTSSARERRRPVAREATTATIAKGWRLAMSGGSARFVGQSERSV